MFAGLVRGCIWRGVLIEIKERRNNTASLLQQAPSLQKTEIDKIKVFFKTRGWKSGIPSRATNAEQSLMWSKFDPIDNDGGRSREEEAQIQRI